MNRTSFPAFLVVALVGLSSSALASVDTAWVRSYDYKYHGFDSGGKIALDRQGNVLVACLSESADLNDDYATLKYDSTGRLLWVDRYNGPDNYRDTPHGLVVDSVGSVYVTGRCCSGGDYDIATIKYSSSGERRWVALHNGPGNNWDEGRDIAVDRQNNVYVTGWEGVGLGSSYVTIKYDSLGNELWVARYRGPGHGQDQAYALVVDTAGNVYVTGASDGDTLSTNRDIVTVKYNRDGEERWVARFSGPGNGTFEEGMTLCPDGQGGVYVAGRATVNENLYALTTIKYDSTGAIRWVAGYLGPAGFGGRIEAMTLDRSGNVYCTGSVLLSANNSDYATLRYDSAGNELWTVLWGGPAARTDLSFAIAVDSFGNAYVTGHSYTGPGVYDYDCVTVKYDSLGNEQWVARYNESPSGAEGGMDVAVDGTGHVYVTGSGINLVHGNYDCVTIKYVQTPGGVEETWTARPAYSGPPTVVCDILWLKSANGGNLIDPSGRRVMVLKSGANDVSRLPPGVYFLITREKRLSRKVVLTGRD